MERWIPFTAFIADSPFTTYIPAYIADPAHLGDFSHRLRVALVSLSGIGICALATSRRFIEAISVRVGQVMSILNLFQLSIHSFHLFLQGTLLF